jgi:hypothetical protein
MAGRLTRFLNLERARKPSDTPHHGVVTKERFGAERPTPRQTDQHFREEREAQLDSGVEIEKVSAGEQPFLRCPVCEADNSKYAVKCLNCSQRLDTEEARAWNEQFWRKRRGEMQEQRRAEGALGQRQEQARDAQRTLGEKLARQVAETEGARLGWMPERILSNSAPIGFRLLGAISSPGLRYGVAAGLIGVFAGALLVAYRFRHLDPSVEGCALLAAFLVVALFLPNTRRRRGWWWDSD